MHLSARHFVIVLADPYSDYSARQFLIVLADLYSVYSARGGLGRARAASRRGLLFSFFYPKSAVFLPDPLARKP